MSAKTTPNIRVVRNSNFDVPPKGILCAIIGTGKLTLTAEDVSGGSTDGFGGFGGFGGGPIGDKGGILDKSVVKRRCRLARASLDGCECVVMKLPLYRAGAV